MYTRQPSDATYIDLSYLQLFLSNILSLLLEIYGLKYIFLHGFKLTEFLLLSERLFAKHQVLLSWNRIFSSRSRSHKIRILSISKFVVYCCHSDIDSSNNCILTNFNSYPITGENFVAIRLQYGPPKTVSKHLHTNTTSLYCVVVISSNSFLDVL